MLSLLRLGIGEGRALADITTAVFRPELQSVESGQHLLIQLLDRL